MSTQPTAGHAAGAAGTTPLVATRELVRLASQGDASARERLLARYLPRLRHWARGRLPMHARSLLDTVDVVQDTLLRVLEGLGRFEIRGPGSFEAYVRRAVINRIGDEVRSAAHRRGAEGVPESLPDPSPSPLENAIGADLLDRYESAMGRLSEEDQQLLHLRIELRFEYAEIAGMTERPSSDAARMAVQRALGRLAEAMGHRS